MRAALPLLVAAALLLGCYSRRPVAEAFPAREAVRFPASQGRLLVFTRRGDLLVLSEWSGSDGRLQGIGQHYDDDRRLVGQGGQSVDVADIDRVERISWREAESGGAFGVLAGFGALLGALALLGASR